MIGGLHGSEWLIILIIVLLLFGPAQLPKLMKSIGEGIRALKKSASGEDNSSQDKSKEDKSSAANETKPN